MSFLSELDLEGVEELEKGSYEFKFLGPQEFESKKDGKKYLNLKFRFLDPEWEDVQAQKMLWIPTAEDGVTEGRGKALRDLKAAFTMLGIPEEDISNPNWELYEGAVYDGYGAPKEYNGKLSFNLYNFSQQA